MNGVVLGELSQDSQDLFITIHYTAIETYQNDVRLESRTPRMARDHVALFCSSSERRAKRRRDSSGNTAVWIRRRFWCVWLRCIVGIVMQVHSCIWRAGRFHLNLNTHVGSVSRQRRAIMRVIMMTKKKKTQHFHVWRSRRLKRKEESWACAHLTRLFGVFVCLSTLNSIQQCLYREWTHKTKGANTLYTHTHTVCDCSECGAEPISAGVSLLCL